MLSDTLAYSSQYLISHLYIFSVPVYLAGALHTFDQVLHHLAAVEHRVSSAGGAAWQAVGEATPALAPAPAPPPSARAPTASTLVTSSVPEGLQLKEPIQPPSRSYDQQGEQWSGSGGGDGYLFLAQQLIGSLRVALLATVQWETQQQAASR